MFLRNKFREYYLNNYVEGPPELHRREFGFGDEKNKISFRHVAFNSVDEFNNYLRRNVPLYVSASVAYYQFPDARPMERKIWEGADLVFDIDAETKECSHPDNLVCGKCLEETKQSVLTLLDFLKGDFGFKNVRIVFSGNRGYHIYVYDKWIRKLDSHSRREIVDYILSPVFEEIIKLGRGRWYERIKKFVLEGISEDRMNNDHVRNNKEKVYNNIVQDNWDIFKGAIRTWKTYFQKYFRFPLFDANVTIDKTKLLRVPGTLHGGSGLLCMPVRDIYSFDPLSDPVVFGDELVPVYGKLPKLRLVEEFEPKKGFFKVPEYLAVYLTAKGYVEPEKEMI